MKPFPWNPGFYTDITMETIATPQGVVFKHANTPFSTLYTFNNSGLVVNNIAFIPVQVIHSMLNQQELNLPVVHHAWDTLHNGFNQTCSLLRQYDCANKMSVNSTTNL